MSTLAGIPNGAIIAVCDGRKALLFENKGDSRFPDLKSILILNALPNHLDAKAMQGSGRPAQARTSFLAGMLHSTVESFDQYREQEEAFARKFATELAAIHRIKPIKALVLACTPRLLGVMRAMLPQDLRVSILSEVNKDLSQVPVYAIERNLTIH